jgi:peptide/nickel transport system permease protein
MHALREFLAKYSKRTLATLFVGAGIVFLLFFLAIFAPLISPYSPLELSFDPMQPPNQENPMGTDSLGRDIFSRVCWGGRASLASSLLAMLIALAVGIPLGAASGYVGGKSDRVLASAVDAFYAFPHYVMALMVTVALGREFWNIAIAVGVAYIPYFFRIVRSVTLSIKERVFIEEEKSIGASGLYILYHHILPYSITSIIVFFSMAVSRSIILLAGLGFLGLGIQPPTPEWGTDMRWGRDIFLLGKWWAVVSPGVMILLAVVGFNLLSEGLNSIFQEREGGRFAA